MTQVSRFRLRPDVWQRIFDLFTETLADLKDKERLDIFLQDFLTPTERIVLAKRLAVAVMLAKGSDYGNIRRLIRVAPNTIARMSFHIKYEGAGLRPVIQKILNRESLTVLWEELGLMGTTISKGESLGHHLYELRKQEGKIERIKREI